MLPPPPRADHTGYGRGQKVRSVSWTRALVSSNGAFGILFMETRTTTAISLRFPHRHHYRHENDSVPAPPLPGIVALGPSRPGFPLPQVHGPVTLGRVWAKLGLVLHELPAHMSESLPVWASAQTGEPRSSSASGCPLLCLPPVRHVGDHWSRRLGGMGEAIRSPSAVCMSLRSVPAAEIQKIKMTKGMFLVPLLQMTASWIKI